MKKRLLAIALIFSLMVAGASAAAVVSSRSEVNEDVNELWVVELNEIDKLYASGRKEEAAKRSAELADELRDSSIQRRDAGAALLLGGLSVGFIAAALLYIWYSILRPFDKMTGFAQEIAKGNFDIPLDYERSNYFGSFTWAFDSMRKEVSKARSCEREAIENNKTVIATLSHDIKTPIASIRAYCEGLEAKLDSSPEKRARYLSVIMRKCDEVSKLTDDLFLHSLSDLDKLKLSPEPFELGAFIDETVSELAAERSDLNYKKPAESIFVYADRSRTRQLCENLINNARKYAKTDIAVSLERREDAAVLTFRDSGSGIPDADLPFIFDKFYRGHNCGSEQGSGLGLYIVKYISEQQGGGVRLRNLPEGGLEAEIEIPLSKPA